MKIKEKAEDEIKFTETARREISGQMSEFR